MPFDLRLDGEVIATVDEQVTGVRLQSARGETSVTGIAPHEGVLDIILDRVAPGGPVRLDQLEAEQMQAIRDRGEEGQVVGYTRDFQVHPSGMRQDQGTHDETLREGGVDTKRARRTRSNGSVPSRDLGEGLLPDDHETRTKRLEAFADHGDAERAINDNPPGGGGQSSSPTAGDSVSSADSVSTTPGSASPEADSSSDDDGGSSGPSSSSSGETSPEFKLPSSGRKVKDSPQA